MNRKVLNVALPGREYIAVRLTRVKEESGAQNA